MQPVPAELRVPERRQGSARHEHGHDRGHEEARQVRRARGVPRQAEPEQCAGHRLSFSRTRTEITIGVPSNPKASRSLRSMNRR